MLVKVVLLVIFLIYSAGLVYGGFLWKGDINSSNVINLGSLNDPASPNYAALQGTIRGKIKEIKEDKVYIETNKGSKPIFSLIPDVAISEFKNGEVSTIGDNKDAVILDREATIIIKGYKNGFAVSSITYFGGSMPIMGQLPEPKK
jgi:hypothetical protein